MSYAIVVLLQWCSFLTKVIIMSKQTKTPVIRANPAFKGSFKPNTARSAYAAVMQANLGKPVSAFVTACAANCPQLTKKGTVEPVKGWVTFLTGKNGPFVIS